MKKLIKTGSTDQTIDVFIQDSTSTSGAGKTGLAYNTAGLKCYYRKGATGSATALTLATQTVGGAHSDGGFVEIDATNMPGMYRLDLSDTIVAAAGSVTLMLSGATGMAPLPIELQVGATDFEGGVVPTVTTVNGFAAGAITAAAIAADAITAAKIADGAIDANTFATGAITAASLAADAGAEIADAVWDEALAGHATAGSAGAALSAAGSAGDPWSTLLPGAYGAGTAGNILGNNLDAAVSTRSSLDAAGVRTAVGLASANLDTQLDALPTAVENADALLGRNIAGGSSSGRTVKQALYFLRNRWTASGGTLTVYETDDATSSWTGVLSSSASADPITGNDPA